MHPLVQKLRTSPSLAVVSALGCALSAFAPSSAHAEQPPPPCHPNPNGDEQAARVAARGDVEKLPDPLKQTLARMANRPHSAVPTIAYAEADHPSRLFQYYLLDTDGIQPNIFTAIFPGVNDGVGATAANAANCGQATIGAVRVVLEPKAGLPRDPNDAGSFVDVFTDLSGLFVINNESGWYEGWMIWDLRVPAVAAPRDDGHAAFGTITAADAQRLAQLGDHHNVPGALFTTDGRDAHLPAAGDHFPDVQSNIVPLHLSMGAFNCLQQSDCHAYWEFNQYTNWVHPLYELPFTGGLPGTFAAGNVGAVSSVIPGSGPSGVQNTAKDAGDNPSAPRDPDRALNDEDEESTIDEHKEARVRFIPSGLAKEVYLDAYERLASFEPAQHSLRTRLLDAYAAEVARVDGDHNGIVDFEEGDLEGLSDGQPNERLYIPVTRFSRFAVTREINDGLLAPRFAPAQRAWVLSGSIQPVDPAVPASVDRDSNDR